VAGGPKAAGDGGPELAAAGPKVRPAEKKRGGEEARGEDQRRI